MIPATAFTILFALWCARDDAQQIARHSKIYHGIQWTFRAAVVGAVCCVCMPVEFAAFREWVWPESGRALGRILGVCVGMAGLFSAVFRWRLNTLRELDWRYVGPWSSLYDCAWLTLQLHIEAKAWHARKWSWPKRWHLDAFKAFYVERSPSMTHSIHRAGTMAYIFEALLFVGVVVLYLQGVMDDPTLARWTWTKW